MITQTALLRKADVDETLLELAVARGTAACDIETTGLNWATDRIRTVQVAVSDDIVVVDLESGQIPAHLRALLENPGVCKIFHHAPFDLRFMVAQWGVRPANVACTKIAAKILDPTLPRSEYSLKPTLARYLHLDISKDQQLSDWSRPRLTDAQVAYAASDVRHLSRLHDRLLDEAAKRQVLDLVVASFEYLPTRVQLDLLGAGDVFRY